VAVTKLDCSRTASSSVHEGARSDSPRSMMPSSSSNAALAVTFASHSLISVGWVLPPHVTPQSPTLEQRLEPA
jgi:hypothetical protein